MFKEGPKGKAISITLVENGRAIATAAIDQAQHPVKFKVIKGTRRRRIQTKIVERRTTPHT